ncbi:uncharacterized protein LOC143776382 isoform X1 [Ranitomeya variabilis]|uniref:uncharacterized protein LOC143776382 isoform X1 n=1 Tax=Ranitomeya variabilis TaxID=490064 RepID=UPI0040571D67
MWFRYRRIYVPEVVRLQILKLVHDSKLAGHRGVQKTQEFLSRFFWWPTCLKDTKDYVLSCEVSNSPVPAVEERLTAMRQNLEVLKESLTTAQERYKRSADRFRKPAPMFKVGDSVWLATKNLKLNVPSQKLGQKFIGPFKINSIVSSVACRLKLPRTMKVHPVFHVSLLKPVSPNTFQGRVVPPPQPVVIDGQEQFVVEEIIDSRVRRNRLQYLIRWQGYPPEEDSWEPVENINAQQKISHFHQRFPQKPGPGSS